MSTDVRGDPTGDAATTGLTPGEHLRAEFERLGLDQVAVSEATGVSRQSINYIVNGRQPISRAMAAKLGRLTGHAPDYWLRASFPRRHGAIAVDDKRAATAPAGAGVLVNHQIIRAIKDDVIAIEPFDETNVQLASIDLTLDDFIDTTAGEHIDVTAGQSFILAAGQTVIVTTKEWVEFPQDHIGRVGAMASLARRGIMTSHGLQIDPGFQGDLQFCLFNAGGSDFTLRGGMPIISIEIMPLGATPTPVEHAAKHLREAGARENVVPFRNAACERLIRDAVRTRVSMDMKGDKTEARIPESQSRLRGAFRRCRARCRGGRRARRLAAPARAAGRGARGAQEIFAVLRRHRRPPASRRRAGAAGGALPRLRHREQGRADRALARRQAGAAATAAAPCGAEPDAIGAPAPRGRQRLDPDAGGTPSL